MRANQKAIASYGDVKVTTGVATANNVQLIQMLFDGLLESLATAKGHIQNGAIVDKGKSIAPPAASCWVSKAPSTLSVAAIWPTTSMSCMPMSPAVCCTSMRAMTWTHWKKSTV